MDKERTTLSNEDHRAAPGGLSRKSPLHYAVFRIVARRRASHAPVGFKSQIPCFLRVETGFLEQKLHGSASFGPKRSIFDDPSEGSFPCGPDGQRRLNVPSSQGDRFRSPAPKLSL
jgi:hypothetical protein